MRSIVVLLVLAVAFSGCSDKSSVRQADADGDDAPHGSDGSGDRSKDVLWGFVFDNALAPVVGAAIEIHGENVTSTTATDGYYGFRGLPTDRVLVLVAKSDGFEPSSKTITLVPGAGHLMNFTLQRAPIKTATDEKQSYEGTVSCAALVRANDGRYEYGCNLAGTVDERVWEFSVKGDTMGIIVEVNWESNTPLADHLNVTVETVGFGDFDTVLAVQEGPSVLRLEVARENADRYYRLPGTVRVTVDVGRNIEDEEASAGAALAFEQGFQVIASIFYVQPPPPGYTAP